MNKNPFMSDTFIRVWNRHFHAGQMVLDIPPFQGISFRKSKRLPLYTNIGATHTKGVSYRLGNPDNSELGNKVVLIYDLPTYFELGNPLPKLPSFRGTAVKQYPGYLIDLEQYKDLPDFLQRTFSRGSRNKLKKYKRKFETAFDVTYVNYTGKLDKGQHEALFESFKNLLVKRFDEKGISNNNLEAGEWNFFKEAAFEMMKEEMAGLFVVYNKDKPVAITLNFYSDTIVFDTITVFDTSYAKFHPGAVSLMGLLEWCFQNNFKILDFSKGYFDYKKQWGTREYDFEYHIYYNPKSMVSSLLGNFLIQYFRAKQALREQGVNDLLHKSTFKIRRLFSSNRIKTSQKRYRILEAIPESDFHHLKPVTSEATLGMLRSAVLEYCYLNEEKYAEVKVFEDPSQVNQYAFKGRKSVQWISLEQPSG
jgi:hypothetical protein